MLGIQHLPHLLPHGEQISAQSIPDALIDGVDGRTSVFAWDGRGEVALGAACGARVGLGLGVGDAAGEGRAVGSLAWVFEVI